MCLSYHSKGLNDGNSFKSWGLGESLAFLRRRNIQDTYDRLREKSRGEASTDIPRQFMAIRERGGSQTKSFKLDVCWENPVSGRSRIYRIIVRKRKLVPGANAMRFSDQSSTAVASTLRLPAIFLGRKNSLRL